MEQNLSEGAYIRAAGLAQTLTNVLNAAPADMTLRAAALQLLVANLVLAVDPTGERLIPFLSDLLRLSETIVANREPKKPAIDPRVDVWTPANLLVKQHGVAGAASLARERIAELIQADQLGADRWHMIYDAILELGRSQPKEGEARH